MPPPLISVVLCSYNGAAFIEEQIQSLLQQTYPNLEIVISDDGSTDGTQVILKAYQPQPQFKVFFQDKTLGPIKNVAFALQQTTGAFIAFCDQDDIWLPQKTETLYNSINDDLLVYSDSELIDEHGQPLHKKLSQLRRMYTGNETYGFVFSNVAWGHTILISRRLVAHLLPIPEGIAHDIWMAVKAATLKQIKYIDVALTKYRQHAASVTKTLSIKPSTRTGNKRFVDYEEKLNWIYVLQQQSRPDEKLFYKRLYTLYAQKKSGSYQWPLLFFMLQHRRLLYRFSLKSTKSQLIDIAKHARGVAP